MDGFGDDVGGLCDLLDARVDAMIRGTALEVLSRVVIRTPVDEGRARGDWMITLDSPDRAPTGIADKNGSDTIMRGILALPVGQTAGRDIYVTNTMPYIRRLEQGHSKQGSHMIERTVNELPEIVDKAAQAARAAYP